MTREEYLERRRSGELSCSRCNSWRRKALDHGECWSLDRLDGDESKGPAGTTYPLDFCEAFSGNVQ